MEIRVPRPDGRRAADLPAGCGRANCACRLAPGERFVLWALRQWQSEVRHWRLQRSLPAHGSPLQRGFELAGAGHALADFALAMDAVLCGARRPIEIRCPACPGVGNDEAMLIGLCGLAQDAHDGPFVASLRTILAPHAVPAAAFRFGMFALALDELGLRLAATPGDAPGRLN